MTGNYKIQEKYGYHESPARIAMARRVFPRSARQRTEDFLIATMLGTVALGYLWLLGMGIIG